MNRGWIGVALLAALLIVGILAGCAMEANHGPSSEALEQASRYALEGNWEKAKTLTGEVRAEWERLSCLTAALTKHDPLEQIDGLFAQLEVYAAAGDAVGYSAVCAQLATMLEAVGQTNSFNFKNLM